MVSESPSPHRLRRSRRCFGTLGAAHNENARDAVYRVDTSSFSASSLSGGEYAPPESPEEEDAFGGKSAEFYREQMPPHWGRIL